MKNINDSNVTIIDDEDIVDGQYKETPKTEADIALEDFLDKARAIGSGATLTINKLSGGVNSAEQFCTRYPVDKYEYFDLLAVIQENWGSGDYRIYCTVKGRKGVLQNQLISIAKAQQNSSTQVVTTEDSVLNKVIQMMNENKREMMEVMRAQKDDGDSMTKALNQMLLMKQVLGNDAPQKSMLSGVKELVETMALLQNLNPTQPQESGLMSALSAFAPVAVAAVTAMSNKPQPVMRPNPQPYRPAPEHNRPNETVINEPKEEAKNNMSNQDAAIAQSLSQLISGLDMLGPNGINPESIAEKICGDLSDDDIAPMQEWASNPSLYDSLVAMNPRVSNYTEWFTTLIEHVKAQLGLASTVGHLYDNDHDGDDTVISTNDNSI